MLEQGKKNKGPGDTLATTALPEPTGLMMPLVVSTSIAPRSGKPQSPTHLFLGVFKAWALRGSRGQNSRTCIIQVA